MQEGERQVATELKDIRRDHVKRYEFAAEYLAKINAERVIDCACGVGYGAWILANDGITVKAADIDEEAIEYAKKHWNHENINYVRADVTDLGPFSGYDAAVCFETIEHIKKPLPFLRRLAKSAAVLIASVPNELVFPYQNYKFHYKHYTPVEFETLLNKAGYEVVSWYGQRDAWSGPEKNIQGRTQIAICRRSENPTTRVSELTDYIKPPESVAIVAMGKSSATYMRISSNKGGRQRVAEEVWAINSMGNVIAHDLLFHMDDCKIQEARAARDKDGNIAGMLDWLKDHPRFITSRKYEDYPGSIEFPLESVIATLGNVYFNSTVAYAVAYAIYIGVKRLTLFGCDFTYPNAHQAESGRGCVEFWLGYAMAKGVDVEVSEDTTLMDANVPEDQRFYGYDTQSLTLTVGKGGITIEKEDKAPPSAEEIEKRYNHER